jgi:phosphate-selective porin OprO/OprP
MKPQTGMEASFSDRSNAGTFIESSMLSSMITSTGARNVGLRVSTGGKNWSGSLGYFGDDVNNNGVALPVNEGAGVHWRLTYAPILSKGKLLHLGTSGYYRDVATGRISTTADPLAGQLRVRAQPEYAIDTTRVIDTGNLAFADTVQVYGLEAAGFYGPVGFQAEYAKMDVSQNAGRPDLSFDGAYAGVNWFLTGESRNYEPRTGVFTRMSPKANLDPSSGTWGAFEVAARWSTLDLNSNPTLSAGPTLLGVRGGEATNYTVGVNWYWNPYLRLMLDYVTADVDNRTNTLPGVGALEGGEFNTLALRVQQEW